MSRSSDPSHPSQAAQPVSLTGPAAGSTWAIATQDLRKRFGHHQAVAGLTITVPAGSIAGFVGPNGAGKTTAIRLLLGLVRPDAGTATVLGHPLTHPARYLPRVGALIEAPAYYPSLSGRANLEVLARLGAYPRSRVDHVLSLVELADCARDPVRTYSQGMKQRLGVAMALLWMIAFAVIGAVAFRRQDIVG